MANSVSHVKANLKKFPSAPSNSPAGRPPGDRPQRFWLGFVGMALTG
jgi:hypothetical protein